ncbi:phenylacetic acid degradation operon negative regulatory protein PaaX [Roseomonas sp. GC11]|uniref:PaaX family transcriptional regulator C-terminal domain-containing protein n=1 Tax=Roseomonas sp. GC11 TaxID=2950546 RepID=UPI002109FD02|nr:PaaX family transcriptional regulator C-terminal domain-containing protein [Roseomonas sp. GC11]MCQ4160020.1 phenylacetic acid degradation operon negative regulatory protein PaaX [Roseomonas sp. GC11]
MSLPRPSPSAAPLPAPALSGLLARLPRPPRTASLIITLYGDVVAPRGGSLWLGSLQAVLDRFGLNEGQVRTAMSRLVEEGWLARSRQGRLSFHRLGARGEAEFAAAARRIYAARSPDWDGRLHFVLAEAAEQREALLAQGFALVAPGLLASPWREPPAGLPAFRAEARDAAALAAVGQAFPLAPLAEGYAAFLTLFAPLREAPIPAPLEALTLRLLLVHEFRRLVLRDPGLPEALLPPGWPGRAARALAGALYHRLLPAAESWLEAEGRGEGGALPPPGPELALRFRERVTDLS